MLLQAALAPGRVAGSGTFSFDGLGWAATQLPCPDRPPRRSHLRGFEQHPPSWVLPLSGCPGWMQLTLCWREQGRCEAEVCPWCRQKHFFFLPFLLQMLWVEFWGFPPVPCPKGDFIPRLWTMIRPGALPSLPRPHHTHTPTLTWWYVSSLAAKLVGWLASHREQLPLALGALWPLATFTGRCAQRGPAASLRGGGISSLPPAGPPAWLWEESRRVWCGGGRWAVGTRGLTLFLYLCHCLGNSKAACKRGN